MTGRLTKALAVAATLALMGTACAGDDGDAGGDATPTTTTSPPTRDEFIGAADAICLRTIEQVSAPRRRLAQQATPAEVGPVVAELAGPLRAELAERRRLAVPSGEEAQMAALLDELDRVVVSLDDAGAAAAAGQPERMTVALTEAVERWTHVDELQREYGFQVCGQEPGDEVVPPASVTPEQAAFIAQGDAICRAANEQAERALADAFSGDARRAADGLARALPVFSRMVDDLARLSPPGPDAETLRSVLETERRALGVVGEAQRLAAAGQPYQSKLDEATRISAPADRTLRGYGFTECGA